MSDAPAKICTVCKVDCSTRKRLRRPDGTYICADCAAATQKPTAGGVTVTKFGDHAHIPASDRYAPIAIERPPEPAIPENSAVQCPQCNRMMAGGSIICIYCGYDSRKGLQTAPMMSAAGEVADSENGASRPKRRKPKRLTCRKCEYDLTGLKANICPECGTRFSRENWRQWNREMGKQVVAMSYIVPSVMLGVGVAIACSIVAARLGVQEVGKYLGSLAMGTAVGTFAYSAMCILYLGWGAPFHLVALRLAGIYAVTDSAYMLMFLSGGRATQMMLSQTLGLVIFLIYLGLLKWLMDLEEFSEALILAILSGGAFFAAKMAIFGT